MSSASDVVVSENASLRENQPCIKIEGILTEIARNLMKSYWSDSDAREGPNEERGRKPGLRENGEADLWEPRADSQTKRKKKRRYWPKKLSASVQDRTTQNKKKENSESLPEGVKESSIYDMWWQADWPAELLDLI